MVLESGQFVRLLTDHGQNLKQGYVRKVVSYADGLCALTDTFDYVETKDVPQEILLSVFGKHPDKAPPASPGKLDELCAKLSAARQAPDVFTFAGLMKRQIQPSLEASFATDAPPKKLVCRALGIGSMEFGGSHDEDSDRCMKQFAVFLLVREYLQVVFDGLSKTQGQHVCDIAEPDMTAGDIALARESNVNVYKPFVLEKEKISTDEFVFYFMPGIFFYAYANLIRANFKLPSLTDPRWNNLVMVGHDPSDWRLYKNHRHPYPDSWEGWLLGRIRKMMVSTNLLHDVNISFCDRACASVAKASSDPTSREKIVQLISELDILLEEFSSRGQKRKLTQPVDTSGGLSSRFGG